MILLLVAFGVRNKQIIDNASKKQKIGEQIKKNEGAVDINFASEEKDGKNVREVEEGMFF